MEQLEIVRYVRDAYNVHENLYGITLLARVHDTVSHARGSRRTYQVAATACIGDNFSKAKGREIAARKMMHFSLLLTQEEIDKAGGLVNAYFARLSVAIGWWPYEHEGFYSRLQMVREHDRRPWHEHNLDRVE